MTASLPVILLMPQIALFSLLSAIDKGILMTVYFCPSPIYIVTAQN